jgi:DNA-binding CsgD family transcriptional regulator
MSDLLDIVEAAYSESGDHKDWLTGLARAAEPHLKDGWGVSAFHLDADARVLAQCAAGVPTSEVEHAYAQGERLLPSGDAQQQMLRTLRDAGPIASIVTAIGEPTAEHDPALLRTIAQPRGANDVLCVIADTLEHEFIGICSLQRERWVSTERSRSLWSRVSAHVGAGLRMRRKAAPESDIVATPGGRIEHAAAFANQPRALEAIRQAVRSSEQARGSLRHDDIDHALELWQALVSGRWSLVDHFDSDGRRYILARENEPNPDGPQQLTPRQRTAVKLRARGHSLKFISYELGLSVPTVSLELREALRVLGVRSVLELGAIFAPASSRKTETQ